MYVIMQKVKVKILAKDFAMNPTRQALRLNVGFLINQPVGTSREFLFDLPEVFLEPDLALEHISGNTRLTRTAQGILLQAKLEAKLPAECVRCLTPIEHILKTEFAELYAFTARSVSESGLILPEDGIIDLASLLREYMFLELPINPLCREDCVGLCSVCGENLNDNPHDHEVENTDPRLEQLKALLDKEDQEY
jgi:uncharacterized protein